MGFRVSKIYIPRSIKADTLGASKGSELCGPAVSSETRFPRACYMIDDA